MEEDEFEEQIGPRTYTIPAKTVTTCHGCKYYSHRMVKSGWHPIYANDCTYNSAEEDFLLVGSLFSGNLPESGETPDWCPFLKKENNNENS